MTYFEKSQRPISERYSHPYDRMLDNFNRFNDMFYELFDSMMPRYNERMLDRPFFERSLLEKPSLERLPYYRDRPYYDRFYHERLRDIERQRDIERERMKTLEKNEKKEERIVQEKAGKAVEEKGEKRALERSTLPLAIDILERPIMDVLSTFEDPFFKSTWESHSTFDRAHKLLDEMVDKGRPNINISKEDDLLKIPEEFEDFYRDFGESHGSKVSGTSYQTSKITRDGKTVTVVRESKLNPDGTISTKVRQHFDDGDGHQDTRSRKKKINFKTGEVAHKIGEGESKKKEIQAEKESQKPLEQEKKEEKVLEQPLKKEKTTKSSEESHISKEQEPLKQQELAK